MTEFIIIYIFILGTIFGSFLNVIIDRLTFGKSILGYSKCDNCGKQLGVKNLVPILSYASQFGKSSCCSKPISLWYPIVELINGLIFVFTIFYFPGTVASKLAVLVILCCTLVIVVSDLKYQLISDEVQLILFFSCIGYIISLYGFSPILVNNVIGLLVVPIPLIIIYLFTKGKAMGFADVKLAASIGVLLGPALGFSALYFSFITGSIVGLFLLAFSKKNINSEIPFGPFLVLGTLLTIYYMDQIYSFLHLYLG